MAKKTLAVLIILGTVVLASCSSPAQLPDTATSTAVSTSTLTESPIATMTPINTLAKPSFTSVTPSITPATPSITPHFLRQNFERMLLTPTPSPIIPTNSLIFGPKPYVLISENTNCRTGPGVIFRVLHTYLKGARALILGKSPDGETWFIGDEEGIIPDCWLWGYYATPGGNTASVPVFTPPALPVFQYDDASGRSYLEQVDRVYDVQPEHIDVIKVNYTLQGELLTAVITLRDLPETLLFNRNGICERCLEYSWEIYIDVDGYENTGGKAVGPRDPSLFGYDYILKASYYKRENVPQKELSIHSLKSNILQYEDDGIWVFGPGAELKIDPDLNTMRIAGIIPGINEYSRILFVTIQNDPYDPDYMDLPDNNQ